ncbi:MAG: HYR domain-containing protein [Bacteroidota bacterium]
MFNLLNSTRVCIILCTAFLCFGSSKAQTLNGSITLSTQAGVDAFSFTEVTGTVTVTGADITNINALAGLTSVGYLRIDDNPLLTDATFPNLTSISTVSGIRFDTNASLTNISFPVLTSSQRIGIFRNDVLISINMPALQSASDDFGINLFDNISLETLDLSSLVTAGSLDVFDHPSLNSVNLGLLETITGPPTSASGNLRFWNTNLSTISLPSLTAITLGNFTFGFNPSLTEIKDVNSLVSIGNSFFVRDNSSLTDVNDFNSLSSVGNTFLLRDNSSLQVCCVFETLLTTPGAIGGFPSITGNMSECNSLIQIQDFCSCDISIDNVTTSAPFCSFQSDGAISIEATCNDCVNGNADLRYSIDGTNFQEESEFELLSEGSYTVYVSKSNNPFCVESQSVSLVAPPDTEEPVIQCTQTVVPAEPNMCEAAVFFETPEAFDFCSAVTVVCNPAPGSIFPVGEHIVECTATDAAGNTEVCFSSVTVEDNQAPEALCQDISADLNLVTPSISINAAAVDAGSNDACGIASLTLSQTEFDCNSLGSTEVTLTVTDSNGLSASCTANVEISLDQDFQDLIIFENLPTAIEGPLGPLPGSMGSSNTYDLLDSNNTIVASGISVLPGDLIPGETYSLVSTGGGMSVCMGVADATFKVLSIGCSN